MSWIERLVKSNTSQVDKGETLMWSSLSLLFIYVLSLVSLEEVYEERKKVRPLVEFDKLQVEIAI